MIDLSIGARIIIVLGWALVVFVVASMVWALMVNLALQETADDSPEQIPSPAPRIIATSMPTD